MEREAGVEPACLGFKAQRDAGNPRRVDWIRRQESDPRGLRSERGWDTSNPPLNKLAGQSRQPPDPAGFALQDWRCFLLASSR
jgi:hypothetical protein